MQADKELAGEGEQLGIMAADNGLVDGPPHEPTVAVPVVQVSPAHSSL